MEHSKDAKPKTFLSRFFIIIGLLSLASAVLLIYIYCGLRIVNNWVDYSSGPGMWLDHTKIEGFYARIGYDEIFRTLFILTICGFFVLSFLFMLIHNRFVKKKDLKDRTRTVVIHDDIISVTPEKDSDGNDIYHPEEFVQKDGYYTLDDLYKRKGFFRVLLMIANVLAIIAILLIIWVFYRGSSWAFSAIYYDNYLGTDEAYILITANLTFILVYYLLRCPDFIKSLAATGFKRIYVRKIHIHETFLGIILTIPGILMVLFADGAWSYLDKAVGLFHILLGVFMIGRDWKDFVMGKFLRD